MDTDFKDTLLLTKVAREFNWSELSTSLPFINFPSDWEIQIIPPFLNGVIRFKARLKGCERIVSVYLDCFDMLGIVGEPYWEIYPDVNENATRFLLNDVDIMLKAIDKSLRTNTVITSGFIIE